MWRLSFKNVKLRVFGEVKRQRSEAHWDDWREIRNLAGFYLVSKVTDITQRYLKLKLYISGRIDRIVRVFQNVHGKIKTDHFPKVWCTKIFRQVFYKTKLKKATTFQGKSLDLISISILCIWWVPIKVELVQNNFFDALICFTFFQRCLDRKFEKTTKKRPVFPSFVHCVNEIWLPITC